MRRFLLIANSSLLVAASVAFVTLATTAHAQTITTFDPANSTSTVPQAINIFGRVTGYYTDATGGHGFVRQRNGQITKFDITQGNPGGPVFAQDINPSGQIVGYFFSEITTRGFLRQPDGSIIILSAPTTTSNTPFAATAEPAPRQDCLLDNLLPVAINALGQITGSYGNGRCIGFLRQPNGASIGFEVPPQLGPGIPFTVPEAINIFGQITGYYSDANGRRGFLRKPSGTIIRFDVPNSTGTTPQAINFFGQVAGNYQDTNFVEHAFLRQPDGAMTTFDPSGSVGTHATAINLEGQITGYFTTADGKYHGFLRKRNGNIEIFEAPGANNGIFPRDINDVGQIVGYYQDPNFVLHGFLRSER